jgi:hypothetical protein
MATTFRENGNKQATQTSTKVYTKRKKNIVHLKKRRRANFTLGIKKQALRLILQSSRR